MINLLKWFHFFPLLEARSYISPLYIPFNIGVPRIFMTYFPAKVFLTNFFNNIILSIENIENHTWRFGFWFLFFYFFCFLLLFFNGWLIYFCFLHNLSLLLILYIFFNYLFCSWLRVRYSINISCLLISFYLTCMSTKYFFCHTRLIASVTLSIFIMISCTHFRGILLPLSQDFFFPFSLSLWNFVFLIIWNI